MKTNRYCYRCSDCLAVLFADVRISGTGQCEACGGTIEYMGRVHRKHSRLFDTHEQCACDGRCTGATGPSCNCSCGGVHHGTGAMVKVHIDKGALPRFEARDPEAQRARADEYRAAVTAAEGRLRARYGGLLDDYRKSIRIASYETWSAVRDSLRDIRHAKGLRSHAGRMRALAAVGSPPVLAHA